VPSLPRIAAFRQAALVDSPVRRGPSPGSQPQAPAPGPASHPGRVSRETV